MTKTYSMWTPERHFHICIEFQNHGLPFIVILAATTAIYCKRIIL